MSIKNFDRKFAVHDDQGSIWNNDRQALALIKQEEGPIHDFDGNELR
ncbi:MAG: hypothetical protein IPL83_04255 [Bdellovibrionales bacterium]|nr:hypothetical protein [Bdellovibrionales bacterium]